MADRNSYLESLLPIDEDLLRAKYLNEFNKYATYTGNGTYHWLGIRATDTRELWLMGILFKEGVKYERI